MRFDVDKKASEPAAEPTQGLKQKPTNRRMASTQLTNGQAQCYARLKRKSFTFQ